MDQFYHLKHQFIPTDDARAIFTPEAFEDYTQNTKGPPLHTTSTFATDPKKDEEINRLKEQNHVIMYRETQLQKQLESLQKEKNEAVQGMLHKDKVNKELIQNGEKLVEHHNNQNLRTSVIEDTLKKQLSDWKSKVHKIDAELVMKISEKQHLTEALNREKQKLEEIQRKHTIQVNLLSNTLGLAVGSDMDSHIKEIGNLQKEKDSYKNLIAKLQTEKNASQTKLQKIDNHLFKIYTNIDEGDITRALNTFNIIDRTKLIDKIDKHFDENKKLAKGDIDLWKDIKDIRNHMDDYLRASDISKKSISTRIKTNKAYSQIKKYITHDTLKNIFIALEA